MKLSKPLVGIAGVALGAGTALAGLIIYIWVSHHSPNMGLLEMMQDPNNYIINHPVYDAIVILAIALGLGGLAVAAAGFLFAVYPALKK